MKKEKIIIFGIEVLEDIIGGMDVLEDYPGGIDIVDEEEYLRDTEMFDPIPYPYVPKK